MKHTLYIFIYLLFLPMHAMEVDSKPAETKGASQNNEICSKQPTPGSPLLRGHLTNITLIQENPPVIYDEKELVVVFESEEKIREIAESEKTLNDPIVDVDISYLDSGPILGAYFGRIIKRAIEQYSLQEGMQCFYLADVGNHDKFKNAFISSKLLRKVRPALKPGPIFYRQKGYGSC